MSVIYSHDASSEEPFAVGTQVTSYRRRNLTGIVKSPSFQSDPHDRRRLVWVDYTASGGPVAIDHIRALRLVEARDRESSDAGA